MKYDDNKIKQDYIYFKTKINIFIAFYYSSNTQV